MTLRELPWRACATSKLVRKARRPVGLFKLVSLKGFRMQDKDLLGSAERELLLETWNRTEADYPSHLCVHELFEQQAARTPDAVAVVAGDASLSYGELNARANQLARRLQAQGLRPDERVAICVERSLEMVVGLLAILKAGGAYVPLDPAYPTERLAFMLCDSAPRLALTHPPARQALDNALSGLQHPPALLDLCTDAALWSATAKDNLDPTTMGLAPDNLAYVIYTSGSTGTPKGVMVEHRNLVCRLCSFSIWTRQPDLCVVPMLTSISFDPSIEQTFLALAFGGTLNVLPTGSDRSSSSFEDISNSGAAYLNCTPTLIALLAKNLKPLDGIRLALIGGDDFKGVDLASAYRLLPNAIIVNVYGPTETTIDAIAYHLTSSDSTIVPIGRPISNTRIYILAEGMEPVPLGAVGEIYIGGAGVARGYLNRPELTAERFLSSPFVQGDRLYRTGDLGRYLPDGNIEFLGRNDHQVKIRGFRIELGEIEARLAEHPQVREAVVVAREAADGDKRLVAYYTAEPDAQLEAADLRSRLAAALPDHMVPAAFVSLQTMPLTPNGKLDRKALPDPGEAAYARQSYEPPQGEVEQALAAIWAELLGVERVGRHDNFFELGGHSLLAVRMVAVYTSRTGSHVTLRNVYRARSLGELATLSSHTDIAKSVHSERDNPENSFAFDGVTSGLVSYQQEGLWIEQTRSGCALPFQSQYKIHIVGRLCEDILRRCLATLQYAHPILRTTFSDSGDGQLCQSLHETVGMPLSVHDLSHLANSADKRDEFIDNCCASAVPTLAAIPYRWTLFIITASEAILLIQEHHLIHDGWSANLFCSQLSRLYNEVLSDNNVVTIDRGYLRYSLAQRARLDFGGLDYAIRFWREKIESFKDTVYMSPSGYLSGVVNKTFDIKRIIRPEINIAVKSAGAALGETFFSVLLATFIKCWSERVSSDRVCILTSSANRPDETYTYELGMYVNILPIFIDLGECSAFSDVIQETAEALLVAQEHRELPFSIMVSESSLVQRGQRNAISDVCFSLHSAPRFDIRSGPLADFTIVEGVGNGTGKFGLEVIVIPGQDQEDSGLELLWRFSEERFERASANSVIEHFESALARGLADVHSNVRAVFSLPAAERELLLETWNRTEADYPSHLCVHELFEQQAARTPDAVAVVAGDASLSYGELNARANQLARRLQAQGLRPDERVAICVERSLEMVVGLLAILKAGGAYVPLDPAYPTERLAFMLCDSAPRLALTHPPARQALDNALSGLQHPPALLDLCTDAALWSATAKDNLDPTTMGLAPDNLAYVIYTSGSTGTPKGVMVEHKSVHNLVVWMIQQASFAPNSRVVQRTSIAFDASVWEVFSPLCSGGSIILVDAAASNDPVRLIQDIAQSQGTALQIPPSLLRALAVSGYLQTVKNPQSLFFGGEPLHRSDLDLVRHLWPDAAVWNLYGPSETCVQSVVYYVSDRDNLSRFVPIGRPISNTRIYILGEGMEPVPLGAVGEIYIGGAGVARGYLNRPELTAERFLSSPFVQGDRLYRTGDLGRYLPDGNIEFLGRNDHQVKIRGFRIELGEIEARLAEHPQVREAVVVAREAADGDKRLVAYYTAEPDAQLEAADLRSRLAAALPDHMVPAAFVSLQTMPLTPNGKLDRKALPDPGEAAYARQSYEPPQGEVEQALAAIWAELLGVERVGRHDNFFELGGHSLLAVRMVIELGKYFDISVSSALPSRFPTLAMMAGDLFSPLLGRQGRGASTSNLN